MTLETPQDKAKQLRPVSTESVADQVTAELRRSILNSTLEPGQALSLRNIAQQLGVSFIPVREALRSLEAQGLVVTERGRSARVAPLDPEQLHAIYRLRMLIEPDICRRAAAGRSDFSRLEKLLDELSDPDQSVEARAASHAAFHVELMGPAVSAWDLRVLEMLWDSAQRYIRYAFDRRERDDPGEHQRRHDAHALLIDAARTGDQTVVRDAVHEHLRANELMALEALHAGDLASQ